MAAQERDLLIVTDNLEFSRTANMAKSASPRFRVHTIPRVGLLWRVQKKVAPPLGWVFPVLRQCGGLLAFRRVTGRRFCYFQALDIVQMLLSKILGFVNILDVVEPFSLAAKDYRLSDRNGQPYLVWRFREIVCFGLSDAMIVVCPEYAEWVRIGSGKDPMVVENFPDLDVFKPTETKLPTFSVIYFGGDSPSRSLREVDLALAALKSEVCISFHVIGPPSLVDQLSAVDEYHGYLPDAEAAPIIAQCHVGLSPYLQNRHTRFTLPNKSFQYAACDVLPVGPRTAPQARFAPVCLFLDSNTTQEWISALKETYARWKNDPSAFRGLRKELIRNGWASTRVWEACFGRLVSHQWPRRLNETSR